MSQVRIRASEIPVGRRSGLVRRALGRLLYPLFSLWLLIPLLRRYRRCTWWQTAREWVGVAGGALVIGSTWGPLADPVVLGTGGALLVLALVLPPLEDPDRLRKAAEKLGAAQTLNGGFYAGGDLEVPEGTPLLLFLTAEELLAACAGRPDRVVRRLPLGQLSEIRLEGEIYKPRYVSFAKEPPRREDHADHNAVCRLALHLGDARLNLHYKGVFARHLAEVAAHTLHQVTAVRPSLPLVP